MPSVTTFAGTIRQHTLQVDSVIPSVSIRATLKTYFISKIIANAARLQHKFPVLHGIGYKSH
jgi:hypothetical protein